MKENSHHNHETMEELESEIQDRIEIILSGIIPEIEIRPLKSGSLKKNPVRLFGFTRIVHNPVQMSMNRAANLLTTFVEESGADFAAVIKNVILIPRLIVIGNRLLTHIFDPNTRSLIFYLYPSRLHSPVETSATSRLQDSIFHFPGIFSPLIENIIESENDRHTVVENTIRSNGLHPSKLSRRMHHFLIPVEQITEEEWALLLDAEEVGKNLMEKSIGF